MTSYVTRCPLWGFNLGIGPFSRRNATDDELRRACGRNTTWDTASRTCIPLQTQPCDAVDLTHPRFDTFPTFLLKGECQQNACGFDDTTRTCVADRYECRTGVQQAWCNANSNCEWVNDHIPCRYRTSVASGGTQSSLPEMRTGCGRDASVVSVGALCGAGTTLHPTRQLCEADV